MNLKRYLAALLLGVFLTVMLPAGVFASAALTEKMQADLRAFEIFIDEDMRLDDNITRAEFSAVVLRMLNVDTSWWGETEVPMNDVNPGDWFYDEVGFMLKMSLMDGYSKTEFGPNDDITYEQAIKNPDIKGFVKNQPMIWSMPADTMCLELPVCGTGDFRSPMLELEFEGGASSAVVLICFSTDFIFFGDTVKILMCLVV